MDYYPAFLLPELRPTEDCKAEFDGCGIEGIDSPANIEHRRIIQITSEFHHVVGILFEDVTVPVLVRLSQVAKGHGIAKNEELSLATMRLNRYNQITQTLASRKFTEHKDFELIPAGEDLYVAVTLILSDDAIKLDPVKMLIEKKRTSLRA